VGDAGQGHRGLFTVAEEELPESIPAPGELAPVVPATDVDTHPASVAEAQALPADFDTRVEAAVARQLRPLREQLNGYETTIRIRDVMGGIGYLFGLAGLIALLKTRKSRSAD
jgi:nickel transport protein